MSQPKVLNAAITGMYHRGLVRQVCILSFFFFFFSPFHLILVFSASISSGPCPYGPFCPALSELLWQPPLALSPDLPSSCALFFSREVEMAVCLLLDLVLLLGKERCLIRPFMCQSNDPCLITFLYLSFGKQNYKNQAEDLELVWLLSTWKVFNQKKSMELLFFSFLSLLSFCFLETFY